jgi:hypothetical protein
MLARRQRTSSGYADLICAASAHRGRHVWSFFALDLSEVFSKYFPLLFVHLLAQTTVQYVSSIQ